MGLHGYIDKQLTSDEKILYRAHLAWTPIILKFLLFLFAAIGVFAALHWWFGLNEPAAITAGIIVLIGVVLQIPAIIRNLSIDIVVTNRRVHSKKGLIIVKDDRESSLSRVDDTDIDFNSIFQRLFNYGSIEIRTFGSDLIKLDKVARPRELKRAINEAKEHYLDPTMNPMVGGSYGQGQQIPPQAYQQQQLYPQQEYYQPQQGYPRQQPSYPPQGYPQQTSQPTPQQGSHHSASKRTQ